MKKAFAEKFSWKRAPQEQDSSLCSVRHTPAEQSMNLALYFISERMAEEASLYAECALECLLSDLDSLLTERTAELLRRYALIAAIIGVPEEAHIALSLGLLIVHRVAGVESDIDLSFVKLADDRYLMDSSRLIERVGRCITECIVAEKKLEAQGE